ncbi:MAG: beta-ketoacyl synthase N-terminal-like domain-containing protein [Myxococcota bacterium]|nr:beta-ketoacyl synthase N-terminal-like domain-containing protein [Myxococcota bacterium]
MPREVYVASVGLTKVDLTGKIFSSVFDLFVQAYHSALENSRIRSFDAVQIGIMDSEEFENRANIATKVVDRIGLTGAPAVRSETASSTGAAAFHEAYYKIASGEFDTVLVIAGERMKMVTTEVATSIMSKTVDPVERRFGFTMPGLIALVTQAWVQERNLGPDQVRKLLARLMHRAHALGAQNPLAAFYGKPEPVEAYYDQSKNLPVATPLMRKDCSPICDGAAAVILTASPQPVRVAGLGSATETSSILDRTRLAGLDASSQAAQIAYWRAGIPDPRQLEGLVVEVHDAFNSLLPIGLIDLGLLDPDQAIAALVGDLDGPPADPYEHPFTGPRGVLPTNLSGGLKARGHPVGGTGLFQIAENYLQLTGGFPNPMAQVADARIGLCHSIGGPGNNVYVTLLELSDNTRERGDVPLPITRFTSQLPHRSRERALPRQGSAALVEAATTIYVTAPGVESPVHVALLSIGNQRVFARMDRRLEEGEGAEQVLAGQRVRLLVKDDGDHYFQIPKPRGLGRFDVGQIVQSIRRRVGG